MAVPNQAPQVCSRLLLVRLQQRDRSLSELVGYPEILGYVLVQIPQPRLSLWQKRTNALDHMRRDF